jgi:hypothetical protein
MTSFLAMFSGCKLVDFVKYAKDVSQLKKPVGAPMVKITAIVVMYILQALGVHKI